MKELARLGALLVGLSIAGRNLAVGGGRGYTSALLVALLVVAALAFLRDGLVTGSALALAGDYVLALAAGDVVVDLAAPVVGALLLLYLDLADLAAALPRDRRVDGALLRATLRRTAGVVVAGTLAGTAAFAVAAVDWPALEAVRAAGALGVVAVVAVPLILLRRPR